MHCKDTILRTQNNCPYSKLITNSGKSITMNIRKLNLTAGILLAGLTATAQTTLWKQHNWECSISQEGCLQQLVFKNKSGNDTIPFFKSFPNSGPSFYAVVDGQEKSAHWTPDGIRSYRASIDGVECALTYSEWNDLPALKVTLTNKGNVSFQPEKAGLKLGIDTYMDKYPEWFGKFFPTLMRNEKTHFYGYMQAPSGKILGIVCPQPVASWSVSYNLGYQDPPPHWFMGHRIESLNLDLLNTLPLPQRNPQNLWQLQRGEQKSWTIAFVHVSQPEQLEEQLHEAAGIPLLRMTQTSWQPGKKAIFDVLSASGNVTVTDDKGQLLTTKVIAHHGNIRTLECYLPSVGLYTVRVTDGEKVAEGMLTAHVSWRWTMEQARAGALKYHQKATSHVESWYGFHSAFLAAQYFPDKKLDIPLRKRFDYLFGLLHDEQKMEPKYHASRIQNTSSTIGMLVDEYQAYGDVNDLKKASSLADWMMNTWQRPDGAYVNHNIVYTSVIYVAKSMLELVLAERKLAETDASWHEPARRHYLSAQRAIDQLVAAQGNFETEGELTFEDGMISCSALQIGMLALMQDDEDKRAVYTRAMLDILKSHDCLTQLRVPDARRRGGTMRYWEAQYDVQLLPNMFNSPHGWSGWRAYATYYAYLLTGEEHWLRETYNAMGAFSNLIDYRTGKLRWAFVVDPYVKAIQACSADSHVTADSLSFGNPHPKLYETRNIIIGEQYVDMISDWQTVNTQDNDVHELFKCIGETMLTNAFVIERADGTFAGYNCNVKRNGNKLVVTPSEKQITNLHCNLKSAYEVNFTGSSRKLDTNYMGWLLVLISTNKLLHKDTYCFCHFMRIKEWTPYAYKL